MHVNQRTAWPALAVVIIFGGLACQTGDKILTIAQGNTATPTRTRTVRPTFTPQPTDTSTPLPTSTPVPPTRTPTRRPTPRPPTPKPPPTASAPQPTVFAYQFHATPPTCEHAGQSYIKGTVYGDKNDPGSGMPGMKVVLGGAGGDKYDGPNTTDDYGDYTFILSLEGQGARPGTYYTWVVDGSGNRISEMGGPMVLNGLPDTNPATCWVGHVYFYR